jgi:hypothetical protein
MHDFLEFVEDLLAILEEKHLALVLRVGGILQHDDVGDVGEATLLRASLTTLRRVVVLGSVPELGVVLADRILLVRTERGAGVLDVPPAWSLESMVPNANERYVFTLGWREEANHGVAVTGLVYGRIPDTVVC